MTTDEQTCRPPVVAILGGGASGAATAFHLARALVRGAAEIVVVEPRGELGHGLAYGTDEPAHRINVPASKMTLIADDIEHFMRWLTGRRIAMSPGTLTPAGDYFPQRRIFGRYFAEQLEPYLADGTIRHHRAAALGVRREGGCYRIALSDGANLDADFLVLAMTHPAPSVPAALRELTGSARLIADPYDNARVGGIGQAERVLVVGTGLTSADVIASLDRRGHRGPITALSRHGLRSRGHGKVLWKSEADFARTPERTALALLRRIRATVAADAARGQSWHATLDLVREQGDAIWSALDARQRARLVRHLRRFWDVHRFRIAPQVEAVLETLIAAGRLEIVAASLIDAREEGDGIRVRYRPRRGGAMVEERFDRVVLTTGPDHAHATGGNPALRALAAEGLITPDPTGLGLGVAGRVAAVAADGQPSETLFVAGPLARGGVGELMGVPEVPRHAEEVARHLAGLLTAREAAPG